MYHLDFGFLPAVAGRSKATHKKCHILTRAVCIGQNNLTCKRLQRFLFATTKLSNMLRIARQIVFPGESPNSSPNATGECSVADANLTPL